MIPILRSFWTTFFRLGSETGPMYISGTGSPEGVVTAPVGSQYSRTDGGANSAVYRKESGAGNTGWVPTTTAAGSSLSVTQETIDFGSTPLQSQTFTITVSGALTSQKVLAAVSANMPAGVDRDELEMDPIILAGYVSASDTVTLQATVASPSSFLTGERNINLMVI